MTWDKRQPNVAVESLIHHAEKLLTSNRRNGNDDRVDFVFAQQASGDWSSNHRSTAPALVTHLKNRGTDFIRVVVHKKHRLKTKSWRSFQSRKQAPAGIPCAIDQHPFVSETSRMQNTYRKIHRGLFYKERQRNKRKAEYQQPA